MRQRLVVLFILPFLLIGIPRTGLAALAADELVLLINKNVPESRQLAEFYCLARHVPADRIVELDVPFDEEISLADYEANVLLPVRQFLRSNGLHTQVRCLVTFYGLPLRLKARTTTDSEQAERRGLEAEYEKVLRQVISAITSLETLTRSIEPAFQPITATDSDNLRRRAESALTVLTRRVSQLPEPRRMELAPQVFHLISQLGGPATLIKHINIPASQPASAASAPATTQSADLSPQERLAHFRQHMATITQQMTSLSDRRFDPQSRAQIRTLARENYGLLEYMRLLHGQLEYLQPVDTTSALDSELALLWTDNYSFARWQGNRLHYSYPALPTPGPMMVMRLDAPTAQIVRDMIVASGRAERDSLGGRFVIDSRGIPAVNAQGQPDDFGSYDQRLRDLAIFIRNKTKVPVTLDSRPEVLAANSAREVALYCGWYSLRTYVPSCTFKPGAVGYHIASWELISLHDPGEKGWVKGLLSDGVVATLGAVAEPYLPAFPLAEDFFPLLLTGKLPLAEVYWKTVTQTSWMVTMIGDPLYTPYKLRPALSIQDLPPRLRGIFSAQSMSIPNTGIQAPAPTGR